MDQLPQTRMIEVYATDPADAQDAARVYARDDMGVHVNDFLAVRLRQPIEQRGDRYIYQVTVRCTVLPRTTGEFIAAVRDILR